MTIVAILEMVVAVMIVVAVLEAHGDSNSNEYK